MCAQLKAGSLPASVRLLLLLLLLLFLPRHSLLVERRRRRLHVRIVVVEGAVAVVAGGSMAVGVLVRDGGRALPVNRSRDSPRARRARNSPWQGHAGTEGALAGLRVRPTHRSSSSSRNLQLLPAGQ